MASTTNGLLLPHQLADMPGEPGAFLLADAAASWDLVRKGVSGRYMWTPRITSIGDAYRNLQRQINVFLQRYALEYATVLQGGRRIVDARKWKGLVYYRHTGPAAAVPGTSNHGKGVAVDVSGLGGFGSVKYNQFAEIAGSLGWSNDEGKSVSEPWHWVYIGGAMPVVNTNTIPSVVQIVVKKVPLDKLSKEEDMARLVKHPRGDYAIVGPGAEFTILGSMAEVETTVGLGMVTNAVSFIRDKNGHISDVVGDIELPNPQMWDLGLQIRNRRRDQNG